jgi:glutathione S-transferase
MAEFVLHCFGESGNCYKIALMLELAGCDWEPRLVRYLDGETRSEAFRSELNVMGEAPVLEHAGKRMTQSGAILTWLAERTGRFKWRNEEERFEVLRWILFDNHKFTSYFATLRFMVGIQKTAESPVTEFLRGRALGAYAIADKHLATRPFLIGAEPTIADLSLAGYVFYPEETGMARGTFPNVEAWAERLKALPGWRAPYDLMPRAG